MTAGETRSVEILLDNVTEYTAFQCDVYMPEGLSTSNFALTSRKSSSHTLSVSTQPDGSQRLLSYSLRLKPYSGNNGALVTMDVTASEDFTGSAVIALRNIMFSDLNGEEIPLGNDECTVTVSSTTLPGDVDGDGQINIGDVVDLIDYLLNGGSESFVLANADVDGDGHITIADVTDLIDMLIS